MMESLKIFFFFIFCSVVAVALATSTADLRLKVGGAPLPCSDADLLEFPLNLEYLEAEFFAWGAVGYGLDRIDPKLADGGPPPIGARLAHLDPFTRDVITQFAYQEVGHVKAIKGTVKGFRRPKMDLSVAHFADVINKAMGTSLNPPFDPYASSLNFLIASYLIPYVGLTGYVGASPKLRAPASKRSLVTSFVFRPGNNQLVAGLLAVESGQDAIIRALLYEHANKEVEPYGITVAEFTNKISVLRNRLGKQGVKDEGLTVPLRLGAEGNILAGDEYSLGYGRTPQEILRVVYGSGNESAPAGFFPRGAYGDIARSFLGRRNSNSRSNEEGC